MSVRNQQAIGEPLLDAVEGASVLDGVGTSVGGLVRKIVPAGPVKDALSGTWLGHALHPLLTDVVIGSFISANLLDVLGADGDGAERLIGVGIAAYLPTAAAGANDWADTEIASSAVRRIGLVHASGNVVALTLYTASLVARRRGATGRGKLLAAAGAGVLGLGGYLGAHMTYIQGVGPNQTAFDPGPEDWTPAVDGSQLVANRPVSVVVGETPVFVLRDDRNGLHAMHDRCSHRGCSLAEGEIEGDAVVCACHGSRFRLADGSVERGPATTGQPSYEVRESAGRIEVRLPAS
jgi:nitrite reductase/ring-hydroxylating ferredoxin subunit/uncharacterized membrane protein